MTEMRPRNRLGINAITIMLLAERPDGVTISEAASATRTGGSLNCASGQLAKLTTSGFLWRVKRPQNTHFFATPEAAEAWDRITPVNRTAHRKQNWSLDLPGTPKHITRPPASKKAAPKPAADAQVITPAGVKHTVRLAPKFDERFQVDPDAHHFGAGFSHVGIGRDVDTGRAWGR